MEAEGEGWDPIKLAYARPHPLSPQGGTFIVVLFVNYYIMVHFLMFFSFKNHVS